MYNLICYNIMLSLETESRLAKLLLLLSEEELAVETSRNILCSDRDFDAYGVFKFVDTEEKGYVTEFNIVSFLRNHSVFLSTQEARQIISFYDRNQDGNLDFTEFIDLCIPEVDYSLRKISRDRQIYDSRLRPSFLAYNVEYSFAKLLGRELDLVQRVEAAVRDLAYRFDFESSKLFASIDRYSFGYVKRDHLASFMNRNSYSLYESELNAVFSRLDIDGDNTVTYLEFRRFLENFGTYEKQEKLNSSLSRFESSYRSPLRESSFRRTFSPNKTTRLTNYSPFRSSNRGFSPERTLRPDVSIRNSPVRRSPVRASPVRLSPERLSPRLSPNITRLSPFREATSTRFSPYRSVSREEESVGCSYEEECFQRYLRDVIQMEREIEQVKIDLALRSDFNVQDLFRVFELDERGFLSESDFKYVLENLGVYQPNEEINLLIKRYNPLRSSTINFADFTEMVSPLDVAYANKLKYRLALNIEPANRYLDSLLPETRYLLQKLFKMLLNCEAKMEGYRQRLNKLTLFNPRRVFENIDAYVRNSLTTSDLVSYFRKHNVFLTLADVELLLPRFDRNRNGRVSYLEFSEEIYPKSNLYFA